MVPDIEDLANNPLVGKVEGWVTSFLDVPGCIACVVYLRGCSIRCQDCHNCKLQNIHGGGQWMSPAELAAALNAKRLPQWVCFQGGEPFDQAGYVERVIALLDPRFKIALYSGYCLRVLQRRHGRLLAEPRVRLLKAGPFVRSKRVTGRFLATSNQELLLRNYGADWRSVPWSDMEMRDVCRSVQGLS